MVEKKCFLVMYSLIAAALLENIYQVSGLIITEPVN